jgi:type II secretory pathway pseudopilin PulG
MSPSSFSDTSEVARRTVVAPLDATAAPGSRPAGYARATNPPDRGLFRSTAFSVVELLITVMLMALLLSMLLPTLRRARQAARLTGCQANMRQTALALSSYVNEANDYLPDGAQLSWTGRTTRVRPWVSHGGAVPSTERRLHGYGVTADTMRCPSDQGDFLLFDGVNPTCATRSMFDNAGACYGTTLSRGDFPFVGYARRSGVRISYWPNRNYRFVFAEITLFAFNNPSFIDLTKARWHLDEEFAGTAVMGDWSARLLRKSTYVYD